MSTYKERYNEIQSLNKQINDLLKINKFKEATKLQDETNLSLSDFITRTFNQINLN